MHRSSNIIDRRQSRGSTNLRFTRYWISSHIKHFHWIQLQYLHSMVIWPQSSTPSESLPLSIWRPYSMSYHIPRDQRRTNSLHKHKPHQVRPTSFNRFTTRCSIPSHCPTKMPPSQTLWLAAQNTRSYWCAIDTHYYRASILLARHASITQRLAERTLWNMWILPRISILHYRSILQSDFASRSYTNLRHKVSLRSNDLYRANSIYTKSYFAPRASPLCVQWMFSSQHYFISTIHYSRWYVSHRISQRTTMGSSDETSKRTESPTSTNTDYHTNYT